MGSLFSTQVQEPQDESEIVHYRIEVRGFTGRSDIFELRSTEEQMKRMTVLQLRRKILERFPQYNVKSLKLHFKGQVLEEDKLLSEYGIQDMAVIHMVAKLNAGGGPDVGMGESLVQARKAKIFQGLVQVREVEMCEELRQAQGVGMCEWQVCGLQAGMVGGLDVGMGDKRGKNRSMEKLSLF